MPGILPLSLRDVSVVAGGRAILDRVDATIDAGPRTVVLGANGAGKSVLLRVMHGLIAPTSGEVRYASNGSARGARAQAMVFQRPVMFRRSALGNLTLALAIAGVPRAERAAIARDALARVGLPAVARSPARVLSGGEQQRLAIARAWLFKPQLLLLDEPTASLDPAATREIEQVIQSIHEAGTKIVLVTHNLGQARRLGDEILFLDRGRLAERSPADRFFTHPATAEAAAFLEGELPWR